MPFVNTLLKIFIKSNGQFIPYFLLSFPLPYFLYILYHIFLKMSSAISAWRTIHLSTGNGCKMDKSIALMWFQSVGENMELCGPIGYTAQIKKSGLDKFKKICYNKKKTHFFPIGAAAFIIVTPHMVHPIGWAGPHLWDILGWEIGLTFNRKNCIWVYRSGTRPFVVMVGPVNPPLYYTIGLAACQ